MGILIERRQATHACAEVVGAVRAGADNAYGGVGARCSGVLAALLTGHSGYAIRTAVTDGGELRPAANDGDKVAPYKVRTYATNRASGQRVGGVRVQVLR